MRLTKDEARILAQALDEYKFNVVNEFKMLDLFNKLHDLQYKLEMFGDDKRRHGRTTQDDFSDLLKRFSK